MHQLGLGRVDPAPGVTWLGPRNHVFTIPIRVTILGRVLVLFTQFQIVLLLRFT
ncbi:hypothetical protein RHGRI_021642 [Rhododendron griersonianum]|uniref:Uncharacterized protein n=1 Tax=Rhododendron griersonianum TaxID=479676 RepID=A0AAV6JRG6_9ERIC|nr:hypothetical protein RHGRI_021642 [Rhododendron griersonianum]